MEADFNLEIFFLIFYFLFLIFYFLYCIYASADAAFAAECVTAFAGAHTGTETALTQFLDLALTMIFHSISPALIFPYITIFIRPKN